MIARTCLQCGTEFQTHACYLKRPGARGVYCSMACRGAAKLGTHMEGKRESRACAACGTVFQCSPSVPKRYCSKECSRPYEARHLKGHYSPRVHAVDEGFFDCIDTEAKAYWLGFITADGCVSRGKNLIVALHASDGAHVAKLAHALNYSGAVQVIRPQISNITGKLGLQFSLTIGSVRLVAALNRAGVMERKSLKETPWQGPAALQRHYWRGVFDGDGSLPFGNAISAYLCGSEEICRSWLDHMRTATGVGGSIGRRGSLWNAQVSGRLAARAVAEYLYKDATVFLDRKMARAELLMASSMERFNPLTPPPQVFDGNLVPWLLRKARSG